MKTTIDLPFSPEDVLKPKPTPPVDQPRLWARYDCVEALLRILAEPRYTHCGRPTPESGAYLEEVKRILAHAKIG